LPTGEPVGIYPADAIGTGSSLFGVFMNRQVVVSTLVRTVIILIIAVAASGSVLYILGKHELVGIGVTVAVIVSLLIAPISSYRVLSLIQQLEETRQDLESISTHDYLTGIYNRRFMVEQASTILALGLRHRFPVSLIMMDIDHFKKINDTYGHTTGDGVLVELARYIRSLIRVTDIFGRYGGEEFIVFMPHTTLEDAVMLAERIREGVKQSRFSNLSVTLSIGVSIANESTRTLDDLIDSADVAMHEAKGGGRDRVVVSRTATA
jgi:diguanylate cyclase (GGDEF)-like protein